ncbi:hypothetical protein NQ020_09925 [Corynebacterium sp. 1222RC1]|uniref:hypothetical protein n=1 Tax=Corynebacterium sp. 1222RC1 TaxID=2968464 RepID=UPI00211BB8B9|nr:hypothetical protein [Corynebacterium sp. 1222RC1]MCQ9355566.1 hypothetical protein [Corynebacterium sp. 1222RC1]
MKKFFSLIAVAVLVIVLPVFVWAVKPAQLDQVLVFNNSQDSNSQPSGVEYFFKNARANPTVTALRDVTYSIDEAKGFDAVYAANEDGKHTTLQQWNQVKMNIDQNRPSVLFAEYGLIHNAEDGDLAQVISEDLGGELHQLGGAIRPRPRPAKQSGDSSKGLQQRGRTVGLLRSWIGAAQQQRREDDCG